MLSVANQPIMVRVFMPSVVILNVVAPSISIELPLDEYPYAECRCTQHDIEWHFSECCYVESHGVTTFSQLLSKVVIL
jgi:hypothetical protein